MQKILLVGAWFFGVTFILGALGILFEGTIIGGLLMLVGAGLLLPPVKRAILDKKPNLSRGKITAIGSILIFISFFFIPLDDEADSAPVANSSVETKQEAVEPRPTTEVIKEKEPIEVTSIPVENKPVVEPEPTIEKTKEDKPVEVIKTVPSEPSTTEKTQDIDTAKVRIVLDKIDQEVKQAKGFDIENSAAVAKKSRRIKALREEMLSLTKDMPSFGNEHGKISFFCEIASAEAFSYWLQVFSERNKKDPQMTKDVLKNYQESKKSCLDAMKEFENS